MKRLFLILALFLLATACARGPTTDLKAGERYSILYTAGSRKAEGIFPVVIYNIDGKEITSERNSHQLPPGRHTIKARGVVDRSWVPGLSKDLSRDGATSLTYQFESGTRYFIGLKAASSRRAEWELVVWKEELVSEGALGFD